MTSNAAIDYFFITNRIFGSFARKIFACGARKYGRYAPMECEIKVWLGQESMGGLTAGTAVTQECPASPCFERRLSSTCLTAARESVTSRRRAGAASNDGRRVADVREVKGGRRRARRRGAPRATQKWERRTKGRKRKLQGAQACNQGGAERASARERRTGRGLECHCSSLGRWRS